MRAQVEAVVAATAAAAVAPVDATFGQSPSSGGSSDAIGTATSSPAADGAANPLPDPSFGAIEPQLTSAAADAGSDPGASPADPASQPVQPAADPNATPPLDADVTKLPSTAAPASDPKPAANPVTPPNPDELGGIVVVTPAGGVAFLDGQLLWWFYTDTTTRQPVRGFWTRGCLGCGFFRTQDGRVRCPAGAFLSGNSCRQVRTNQATTTGANARAAPPYSPPTITASTWGKPLSCTGCTSQPAPASAQAPVHKPLKLTELPVPAALSGVYGLAVATTQPPEGGVSFTYRGRNWWYFAAPAAAGGTITTYGFWEDKNRVCFGCGFFYEYRTGAAPCPMGYFSDPRNHTTCTKPASAQNE
ncbi:hypothetical protein WJX81_001523 [Elliptochloris bilobata]|uniref:Uncharacterized protein n=1 Tax=Elliptochloris bilobata TaxID=381761 RepID=A0AAW1RAI0_9CHLO